MLTSHYYLFSFLFLLRLYTRLLSSQTVINDIIFVFYVVGIDFLLQYFDIIGLVSGSASSIQKYYFSVSKGFLDRSERTVA